MKIILKILILLILLNSNYFGTPQSSDLIIIDSDTLALYSLPLEEYLSNNKFKTKSLEKYGISTACNRNYIAVWEMENDSLFLVKLRSCISDTILIPLNLLFPKKNSQNKIFANWVNETIWAEHGKKVYYEHSGFGWFYDKEKEIEIRKGKIINVREHDYTDKTIISITNKDDFSLKKYICKNANWDNLEIDNNEIRIIVIQNSDSSYVIKASDNSNDIINKEALRIVKLIQPTIIYQFGTQRKLTYNFPIIFSEEIKNMCRK